MFSEHFWNVLFVSAFLLPLHMNSNWHVSKILLLLFFFLIKGLIHFLLDVSVAEVKCVDWFVLLHSDQASMWMPMREALPFQECNCFSLRLGGVPAVIFLLVVSTFLMLSSTDFLSTLICPLFFLQSGATCPSLSSGQTRNLTVFGKWSKSFMVSRLCAGLTYSTFWGVYWNMEIGVVRWFCSQSNSLCKIMINHREIFFDPASVS